MIRAGPCRSSGAGSGIRRRRRASAGSTCRAGSSSGAGASAGATASAPTVARVGSSSGGPADMSSATNESRGVEVIWRRNPLADPVNLTLRARLPQQAARRPLPRVTNHHHADRKRRSRRKVHERASIVGAKRRGAQQASIVGAKRRGAQQASIVGAKRRGAQRATDERSREEAEVYDRASTVDG